MAKNLRFYFTLKKVVKSPYKKREEYRRHVTLVSERDRCTIEVDIDSLTNYERYTHKFLFYAYHKIEGVSLDDDDNEEDDN